MKKILFLPLFNMPSGHHQVADAIMDIIGNRTDQLQFKKVDLLSYSSPTLEKLVSKTYLKWIRHTPKTYDWAYKHFAYTPSHKQSSFSVLEAFFARKLSRLIDEENPDLIVVSHGFPSLLLSHMKIKGLCHIPVVNVYTDFFINDIWGRQGVDFHLVSNQSVKEQLVNQYKVPSDKVIISGIPIHEVFTKATYPKHNRFQTRKILVAGGSSGLGNIVGLINQTKPNTGYEYIVLCGNNDQLYQEIKNLKLSHVKPLPYISSREDMNKLYNEVDAIVTKPGGITVSEALTKRLPIFIHSALPGQEDINLQYLRESGLIYEIQLEKSFEPQIKRVLSDELEMRKLQKEITDYLSTIELNTAAKLYYFFMLQLTKESSIYHKMNPKSKKGIVNKLRKYAKKSIH